MGSIARFGIPLIPIRIGYYGSCPACKTLFIIPIYDVEDGRFFVTCTTCGDVFLIDTDDEYEACEEEDEDPLAPTDC